MLVVALLSIVIYFAANLHKGILQQVSQYLGVRQKLFKNIVLWGSYVQQLFVIFYNLIFFGDSLLTFLLTFNKIY